MNRYSKHCFVALLLLAVFVVRSLAQTQQHEQIQVEKREQTQALAREQPRVPRYLLSQKKYTFTVQPLQLFNYSFRNDIEMRLKRGPGWLQFSPAFYYSSQEGVPDYYYIGNEYHKRWYGLRLHQPFTELKGAGLDINYKRYLDPLRSFYTSIGVSYTYFDIKYHGYALWDYIEDGLIFYKQELGFITQNINRIGINTYVGFQVPAKHKFIFDFFAGIAYRHSISDKNKALFDESMISFGYSGIVLQTGVKFGFGLRGKNKI